MLALYFGAGIFLYLLLWVVQYLKKRIKKFVRVFYLCKTQTVKTTNKNKEKL